MAKKPKKVGVAEAQALLAKEPNVHLPTLRAMCGLFCIPVVVGQEVATMVSALSQHIERTQRAKAQLLVADKEDEKTTEVQIQQLYASRRARADANKQAAAQKDAAASETQTQITDLRDLAAIFSQPS